MVGKNFKARGSDDHRIRLICVSPEYSCLLHLPQCHATGKLRGMSHLRAPIRETIGCGWLFLVIDDTISNRDEKDQTQEFYHSRKLACYD